VTSLTPIQQEAVDWFLTLKPRRGTVALPPGAGKTRIALAIAQASIADGPVLVVAPAAVLGAWSDWAEQLGLDPVIVGTRTLPLLISARNEATHGRDAGHRVWIVAARMVAHQGISLALQTMPWAMVVFDEAHRIPESVLELAVSAPGALFLTATPDKAQSVVAGLPMFAFGDPLQALNVPVVRRRVVEVQATRSEAAFLAAVMRWDKQSGVPDPTRGYITMQSLAGVLPAIEAIEAAMARTAHGGNRDEEGPLKEAERKELDALLGLAYAIDLPDSRSARIIEEIRGLSPSRSLIVASLVAQLAYLTALARDAGVETVAVIGAMDKAERADAIQRAHTSGSLLLMNETALSGSAARGRNVLLHGDLPSPDLMQSRESSLIDSPSEPPIDITSVLIRWKAAPTKQSRVPSSQGKTP
jgi:hypothetical protein